MYKIYFYQNSYGIQIHFINNKILDVSIILLDISSILLDISGRSDKNGRKFSDLDEYI